MYYFDTISNENGNLINRFFFDEKKEKIMSITQKNRHKVEERTCTNLDLFILFRQSKNGTTYYSTKIKDNKKVLKYSDFEEEKTVNGKPYKGINSNIYQNFELS